MSAPVEELKKYEIGKWHPSTIGGAKKLLSLFDEQMVSVEYGSDLGGGVERKVGANTILDSPEGSKLVEMLDATEFDFSEWLTLQPSKSVIVFSYRVTAAAFGWTAYATSIWSNTDDLWRTVFYQASRARPAGDQHSIDRS